jgi:hypothetical protein
MGFALKQQGVPKEERKQRVRDVAKLPETVVVGDGPIAGRIRIVEDVGSEVFVHLVIDHEGEERRIVAKVAAPFVGVPDENVRLRLRGTLHLFDTAEVRQTSVTL